MNRSQEILMARRMIQMGRKPGLINLDRPIELRDMAIIFLAAWASIATIKCFIYKQSLSQNEITIPDER